MDKHAPEFMDFVVIEVGGGVGLEVGLQGFLGEAGDFGIFVETSGVRMPDASGVRGKQGARDGKLLYDGLRADEAMR